MVLSHARAVLAPGHLRHFEAVLAAAATPGARRNNAVNVKVSSQLSKASSPPALGFKKLILIRHAQAYHNVFEQNWANKVGDAMMDPHCPLDPCLTELGEEQAYSLHKTSKAMLCKSMPRTHPSPPKPQNTNPAPPQPSLRSCFSRLLALVFARRQGTA